MVTSQSQFPAAFCSKPCFMGCHISCRKMWSNCNNPPTIYYFESSMREIMLAFFADFKFKEILVIAQIRCNIASNLSKYSKAINISFPHDNNLLIIHMPLLWYDFLMLGPTPWDIILTLLCLGACCSLTIHWYRESLSLLPSLLCTIINGLSMIHTAAPAKTCLPKPWRLAAAFYGGNNSTAEMQ